MNRIDYERLAQIIKNEIPLSNKDVGDLLSLHIYLNQAQPKVQVAILAVQGGSLVTIESKTGEAEDGEVSPCTHIIQLEKLTVFKDLEFFEKNFDANQWIISDVDMFLYQTENEEVKEAEE